MTRSLISLASDLTGRRGTAKVRVFAAPGRVEQGRDDTGRSDNGAPAAV